MQLPVIPFSSIQFTLATPRPKSLIFDYGQITPPTCRRGPGFQRKFVSRFTGVIAPELVAAREHMRKTGWSYRTAAAVLDCSHVHLALVLTGHRISHSLLRRILSLPVRSTKRPHAA